MLQKQKPSLIIIIILALITVYSSMILRERILPESLINNGGSQRPIKNQFDHPYFMSNALKINYNEFEMKLKRVPEVSSNGAVGQWIAKSFFDRSKLERSFICSYAKDLENFVMHLYEWNVENKKHDMSKIIGIKPETKENPEVLVTNYLSKFVLFLCTQTKAGLEIEIKFYPCNKDFENDREDYGVITQGKKRLEVRSLFKPTSRIRFNFEDTDYYGLGFDVTERYFTKEQLDKLEPFMDKIGYFENPFHNYEFRTYGGLDLNRFTESYQQFNIWYKNVREGSIEKFGDEQNPVGYYLEKGDLSLCIKSDSVEKPTFDIMYKEQVTLSFHIAQLLPIINLLLDKFHVTSPTIKLIHNFIKEGLIPVIPVKNALSKRPIYPVERDVIVLSGALYLHSLDLSLGFTKVNPMSYRIKNQANLLLLLACQWFKDLETYREKLKDLVNSSGNNFMKAFSPILLRKPERTLISKDVIELFLETVTPFYNIYLPLKVCVKIPEKINLVSNAITEFHKFRRRAKELKEYLNKWRNKINSLPAEDSRKSKLTDSLNQGYKYISHLNSIVQQVEVLKSFELTPEQHIESCFDYSFSMYLVDLLHYDLDDSSLIIEKLYCTYKWEEMIEARVFPITEVDDREPTTVVAEFRSIPAKKNDFYTSELEEFAQQFYEKNIKSAL